MIRLAFMTDKARVLGASTDDGHAKRLAVLPEGLHPVMMEILAAENILVGRKSYQDFYSSPNMARKDMFVLTRDGNFEPKAGIKVCNDYLELAERFKDSDDELVIIGGLEALQRFTPFAQVVDVAETTELVPGDLVFDDRDQSNFELVSSKMWNGGKTLHNERKIITESSQD